MYIYIYINYICVCVYIHVLDSCRKMSYNSGMALERSTHGNACFI